MSAALFATPWTVVRQAPPSMWFSRQENGSGVPCSPSEDLPNPGIKPRSPSLQVDSWPSEPPGKPSWNLAEDYILSRVLKHDSDQKNWPYLDTRKQRFMLSQKLVVYYQTRTRLLSFSWWQFPGEQDSWKLLRSKDSGSQRHMHWSVKRDLGRGSSVVAIASTMPWHHILLLKLTQKV